MGTAHDTDEALLLSGDLEDFGHFYDHRQAPDGIDGANGVQIEGGLTEQTASQTAALLSSGPLPAELVRMG